jgi:hypothetical protein
MSVDWWCADCSCCSSGSGGLCIRTARQLFSIFARCVRLMSRTSCDLFQLPVGDLYHSPDRAGATGSCQGTDMTTPKLYNGEQLCTINPSFKFGHGHLCSPEEGARENWCSAAPAPAEHVHASTARRNRHVHTISRMQLHTIRGHRWMK